MIIVNIIATIFISNIIISNFVIIIVPIIVDTVIIDIIFITFLSPLSIFSTWLISGSFLVLLLLKPSYLLSLSVRHVALLIGIIMKVNVNYHYYYYSYYQYPIGHSHKNCSVQSGGVGHQPLSILLTIAAVVKYYAFIDNIPDTKKQ